VLKKESIITFKAVIQAGVGSKGGRRRPWGEKFRGKITSGRKPTGPFIKGKGRQQWSEKKTQKDAAKGDGNAFPKREGKKMKKAHPREKGKKNFSH